MREGARRLAGPHRRVDPVAVEEGARDLGHVRREILVGRQHRVLRFVPSDRRLRGFGQRRVAVPVVHRLHAEPARLHRIVAVRQARIGVANGGGERIHDAFLDAVGQVAGIGDVLEAAPAVGDFLVLGQRVGDQREGAQILAEGRGQRLGRLPAHLAVGVLQPVQRRLQRQLLAVDVEAQFGHRLVEQAVPGAAAGHRLFVEELLDAVLELVGLVLPQIEHPGPVVAEQPGRRRAPSRSARRRSGSVPARRTADARWRPSSSPGCRHRAWRAAGRTCRRHRPARHRRRCGRSVPPAPRSRAVLRRAGRSRPFRPRPPACPSSGSRTPPNSRPARSMSAFSSGASMPE